MLENLLLRSLEHIIQVSAMVITFDHYVTPQFALFLFKRVKGKYYN